MGECQALFTLQCGGQAETEEDEKSLLEDLTAFINRHPEIKASNWHGSHTGRKQLK